MFVCLFVVLVAALYHFFLFLLRFSYYGKYVIMLLTMFQTLFQVFMSMKENNVM